MIELKNKMQKQNLHGINKNKNVYKEIFETQ